MPSLCIFVLTLRSWCCVPRLIRHQFLETFERATQLMAKSFFEQMLFLFSPYSDHHSPSQGSPVNNFAVELWSHPFLRFWSRLSRSPYRLAVFVHKIRLVVILVLGLNGCVPFYHFFLAPTYNHLQSYNSLGQDPCTVASSLGGVCNGGRAFFYNVHPRKSLLKSALDSEFQFVFPPAGRFSSSPQYFPGSQPSTRPSFTAAHPLRRRLNAAVVLSFIPY